MAAFVLAMIVNNCQPSQEAALQANLIAACLEQLSEPKATPLLKQWLALCLGKVRVTLYTSFRRLIFPAECIIIELLCSVKAKCVFCQIWTNYDAARWCGVRDSAHEKLYCLLDNPVPEVSVLAFYTVQCLQMV